MRFSELVCAVAILIVTSLTATSSAQTGASPQVSPEDFQKYSGMLTEMAPLIQKFHTDVQFPAPRANSRLLPLLPESTVLYVAVPNYGETAHQALSIFRQELRDNPKLRTWWGQGDLATEGPKMEDAVEKLYQLSQYLGEEIVVCAATADLKDPKFVLIAEAKKPGLKEVLPKILKDLSEKSVPSVRVLDAAELAAVKEPSGGDQPVVLIRPDYVILGENIATLRSFNERLDQNPQGFASTEFGQRLLQEYEGGATIVAGLDLRTILKKEGPKDAKGRAEFERTGFSDMKHLVWAHKIVRGQEVSQLELTFNGPRRGIASWLAAPAPMKSLEFVSPEAVFAASILLKDPAQVYDEIVGFATASNPNALASVTQMEQGLNLSLRSDLLAHLGGEITAELDTLPPKDPVWKVLLKAKDPAELLATFRAFFAASGIRPRESNEDGLTYYTLPIPSQGKKLEVSFAVTDGYLIFASSPDTLAEGVRLHRNGESLGRSRLLATALPPSDTTDVSALLYEDPRVMSALSLSKVAPQLAESLMTSNDEHPPVAVAVYGDERALREASRSTGVDFAGSMVVAAVAIPNLLRARMAANESSAVSNLRTANTAEITYAASYPQKGYARDLASLGPGPNGSKEISSQHASLIDATLGDASCTAGNWCIKSGYRFTITTACKLQKCREYVVTATPVNASTGTRSFCSTSDAIPRFRLGAPLKAPLTAAQCLNWEPLN